MSRKASGRPMSKVGFIYFIKARDTDGPIKIGFTRSNPNWRLANMQSGSPLKLELLAYYKGTLEMEKRLHTFFASKRSHGEWFNPCERLLAIIRGEAGYPEDDEEPGDLSVVPDAPQHWPAFVPHIPVTELSTRAVERMILDGKTVDQIAFTHDIEPVELVPYMDEILAR